MSDAPKWDGRLFPCGSRTEKCFRALPAVPQLPEKDEGAFGDALPLLKQKKAPWIGGRREFTSFLTGWGILAHRRSLRMTVRSGMPGNGRAEGEEDLV